MKFQHPNNEQQQQPHNPNQNKHWKNHHRNKHRKFPGGLNNTPMSKERETLPEGTTLITVPAFEFQSLDTNEIINMAELTGGGNMLHQKVAKKSRKEWLLNPTGKSMICILHEYIQHSTKGKPDYKFEEIDSATTPYAATVLINGIEYGSGVGSSKKFAKNNAARKTLEILIPEVADKLDPPDQGTADPDASSNAQAHLEYFDNIRVEDPRVFELCKKTSEPAPYAILVTCLQRNFGLGDTCIHTELKPLRHKKNEFRMKVNNREVVVICNSKRDGKQLAAQKLLQMLHPQVESWGQLLRLYGSRAILTQKAKRSKESEITSLQTRNSSRPAPNLAILEKLKEEMRCLSKIKKELATAPLIGKFLPPTVAEAPDTRTARIPGIINNPPKLEKVNL